MKHFIFTLLLFIFLTSCKSSQSIADYKTEIRSKNNTSGTKNLKNARGEAKKEASEVEVTNVPEEFSYTTSEDDVIPYLAYQVVEKANEYYGVRYRMGGMSKTGIDCSALVCRAFETTDIKLPRTSNEMSRTGRRIEKEEVRKGDLIFFKTRGRSVVNHVGLVVENNEGEIKFIHASSSKGVTLSSLYETYYKKTFSHCNRVL